MHAFFCALSFVLVYFCESSPTPAIQDLVDISVYPETRGVPLEEMDALFGDEVIDDDDEDGDGDDDGSGSDTSSLTVRDRRGLSPSGYSLPTSRKPSPVPGSRGRADSTVFGRIADTVGGVFGRKSSGRGEYNAVTDDQ